MTPQKMEILRMRVQSEVELPYRKVNCFYCSLHNSCVACALYFIQVVL